MFSNKMIKIELNKINNATTYNRTSHLIKEYEHYLLPFTLQLNK